MMQYTLTNDTVTVFVKGEPHSVTKGAPNYLKLREAVLREDWDAVPGLLTVEKAVETWIATATQNQVPATPAPTPVAPVQATPAQATPVPTAKVEVKDERVVIDGEALPRDLNDRILKMTAKGESALGLINFWKRLKRNPNPHSVQQLFGFLQHTGIPIQEDGTFLAYKGVRRDFRDQHSGMFDNSPGKTIKMDRSKVSSDPNTACHVGLHVGALGYARSFAAQCIIVRVDPANVVCVPNDHSQQKMRTCEYTVVGLYGSQMPDTSFQADAPVAVQEAAPVAVQEVAKTDAVAAEAAEDGDEGYEVMTSTPTYPITGTAWDDFNKMTPEELLGQPLSDLRKYALYNCGITGASKLPGGKDTLVAKIAEVTTKAQPPAPPPPAPVEETPPAPEEEKGMQIPLTGTAWDRLNGLNSIELLQESLEDLRRYARNNCLIVGASKMEGGKVALVARIVDVRGDAKAS